MNSFVFQGTTLSEFAAEFYAQGGRTLLIDQVYKVPNWSAELRRCYDELLGLRIVFTGSSVMRLKEENAEIGGIVKSYNLRGLSFREYLNLHTGLNLQPMPLSRVVREYRTLEREVGPQAEALFEDYLRSGFYPFFLEKGDYAEYLLKIVNMMIEVDILMVKQIELKYLSRIKRLLYLLGMNGRSIPNVSQLAEAIGTSRATVMNYIRYLQQARLINVLYKKGEGDMGKKPARITLHNTNLMSAILPREADGRERAECYLMNALGALHTVEAGDRTCDFFVDEYMKVRLVDCAPKRRQSGIIYIGEGEMPLWTLGLIY